MFKGPICSLEPIGRSESRSTMGKPKTNPDVAPMLQGVGDGPALPESAREFPETMGLIVQSEGLSRIAGRVLGLLIIEDDRFSFQEIADRLGVSRASVSTNVRLLEELGLIVRVAVAGERTEFFRLARDPYVSLIERQQTVTRRAKSSVEEAMDRLPADRPDLRERLAALARFYAIRLEVDAEGIRRLAAKD